MSFSELENDTLNQAELNEIKINENYSSLMSGDSSIKSFMTDTHLDTGWSVSTDIIQILISI